MGTTNYHTALAAGAPLQAAVLEAPLSALDQAITNVVGSVGSSALFITTMVGTNNSGQKVVNVVSTVGAVAGQVVWLGDAAGTHESGTINTIQPGTSLTMVANLVNTYAAGKIVSTSPQEVVDARGSYATLGARLAAGAFIRVLTITASGTYTPTTGAAQLYVECVGGGGGGGAVLTAATYSGAGNGGGGGAYSAAFLTGAAVKASFAVVVGAAGVAGVAGVNDGLVGGDTTFDSPSVCTAKGGGGGKNDAVAAGPRVAASGPGAGGAAASGVGDLKLNGSPGLAGLSLAAAQAVSGAGGAGGLGGGGGLGVSGQSAGWPGGLGGGGGGGACILSGGANVSGGAGGAGFIRVWEF